MCKLFVSKFTKRSEDSAFGKTAIERNDLEEEFRLLRNLLITNACTELKIYHNLLNISCLRIIASALIAGSCYDRS